MFRRTLRALAALATLLTCALAPPAVAASTWQTEPDPIVSGSGTGITSTALSSAVRGLTYVDSGTLKLAARPAGATAYVHRTVSPTGAASSAVAAVGETLVVAWRDASRVRVRESVAGGDLAAARDVPGSNGSGALQLVALDDGTVLLTQAAAGAVNVWRRPAGGGAFVALPPVMLTPVETVSDLVLRATPAGGAVLAVGSGSSAPPMTVSSVRAARYRANEGTFTPAEPVDSRSYLNGTPIEASLGVHDVIEGADGAVRVAYRETSSVLAIDSTSRLLVRERSPAGTWDTQKTVDSVTSNTTGGVGVPPSGVRLLPAGEGALLAWTSAQPGASGPVPMPPPQPVTLWIARSADGFASRSALLTAATSGEALETRGGTELGDGRSALLVHRASALRALTLDAHGAVASDELLPGGDAPQLASVAGDGAGSVLAAVTRLGGGGTVAHQVSFLDGGVPEIGALDVPEAATAGQPVRLSATVVDNDRVDVTWELGDGRTAEGATVETSYAVPGTYVVKVTATDGGGNTATAEATIVVGEAPPAPGSPAPAPAAPSPKPQPLPEEAGLAPRLTDVRLSRRTLMRSGPGSTTTLSWRLPREATVRIAVQRLAQGYASGKRCLAKRPKGKGRKRCVLVTTRKTVAVSAPEGSGRTRSPARGCARARTGSR